MTFNAFYLYALVQEFLAKCGEALEAELALGARRCADPRSRAIRSTIFPWLRALRSGDEVAAFRPEIVGRVLDALHAHAVQSVGLGGAQRAQISMDLAPTSLAIEMAVEIAMQLDAKSGGAIVPEFRRRQREHEGAMRCLAFELEARAIGDDDGRARLM